MIEPILTALSVFGAWAVTEPAYAKWGFSAWIIADIGWIYIFKENEEYWACFLFIIYLLLAIKGVYGI